MDVGLFARASGIGNSRCFVCRARAEALALSKFEIRNPKFIHVHWNH
jgi:hypothetical protein